MTATLFVASLHHRAAPLDVRERLALGEPEIARILADIDAMPGVAEAMILSTCNRVEFYGVDVADGGGVRSAIERLCAERTLDPDVVRPYVVVRTGNDAIAHAARVASSLDSLIVGEPQILGQVKDAFALAQRCGTVGRAVYALMTHAFAVAKRVRTETALGQHAVSVPFAAVELARKIFGSLDGRGVLLIGAGEMGELAARHLRDHGAGRLHVANRTAAKAIVVADAVGGEAIPLDRWHTVLRDVDIVITAAGAPAPIVTRDLVRAAVRSRGARPLFFIDIAVPRDVETGVGDLDAVYCYDVDDLRNVVEANRREREREARRAETLVARDVERFVARLGTEDVTPTIVGLRERAETVRQAEVARTLGRLRDRSPETERAIEALSQALVNKILHAPTARLRESSVAGDGARWAHAVAELFALERASDAPSPAAANACGIASRAPGPLAGARRTAAGADTAPVARPALGYT